METKDKRASILKAASSCFARYGYEKTTLDDIGKLVGLNKASLYYYYKNKEQIYAEVIFHEASDFMDNVLEKISKVANCGEKISVYLMERFRYARNTVNLNQLSRLSAGSQQILAPFFTEMMLRITDREIGLLSAILNACARNGEIQPCDAPRIAKSILAVSESILNKYGACSYDASDEVCKNALEEVCFTTDLILKGLKMTNGIDNKESSPAV